MLAENGIMLRRPGEYRKLVRGMVRKLDGQPATQEEQETLLASIIRKQNVSRLIMSDASFLGVSARMLSGGELFQNAGRNAAAIRNLLPDYPVEFFLCIRNPATFLPEAFNTQTEKNFGGFFKKTNLPSLRWSNVILDIQRNNPDCKITVWCYEDLPIIWPTVLNELTGLDPQTSFKGGQDVIMRVLTSDGAKRLEGYIADHPTYNEAQHRRVRNVFFEKFADDNAVEDEIDLSGWSEDLIERLTELYDDDTELIEWMPGVDFISA